MPLVLKWLQLDVIFLTKQKEISRYANTLMIIVIVDPLTHRTWTYIGNQSIRNRFNPKKFLHLLATSYDDESPLSSVADELLPFKTQIHVNYICTGFVDVTAD